MRSLQSPGTRLVAPVETIIRGCILLGLLFVSISTSAQTLARPGWAGSGMTVERWWPHAVLCGVEPDSIISETAPRDAATLPRLAARLEDLQTLGVDAVLLRGLETSSSSNTRGTPAGTAEIDQRYGTPEAFDSFLSDAGRHGIRVLVALRPGLHGQALTDDARFWLNRGVTGLALASDGTADVRTLRTVLHGYIGERVLIAESNLDPVSTPDDKGVLRADDGAATQHGRAPPVAHGDHPDLQRITLPAIDEGVASMRSALDGARAAHAFVPLLSLGESKPDAASARPLATVLLGSGGAALLRIDDLDLSHASDPSGNSVFAWYRQWSGLHRGNAVMRSGDDTLLDHDADGALVWVRQRHGSTAPVVAICNLTGKPVRLSLLDDMQKLHLRGSFLRTIARSDGGMGAMPLREVVLPPFGVYVGELSR